MGLALVERMVPGLFGYSLIFELFVLYLSWTFILSKMDKNWLYLVLGLIILLALASPSSGEWASIFGGQFGFVWSNVAHTLGLR